MRRFFRVTRRRNGRSDGVAMVEAAIAIPVLLVIVGAIVQLVLIIFTSISLHQAAMAAGRAAILQSSDDAVIIEAAKSALVGVLDWDSMPPPPNHRRSIRNVDPKADSADLSGSESLPHVLWRRPLFSDGC